MKRQGDKKGIMKPGLQWVFAFIFCFHSSINHKKERMIRNKITSYRMVDQKKQKTKEHSHCKRSCGSQRRKNNEKSIIRRRYEGIRVRPVKLITAIIVSTYCREFGTNKPKVTKRTFAQKVTRRLLNENIPN